MRDLQHRRFSDCAVAVDFALAAELPDRRPNPWDRPPDYPRLHLHQRRRFQIGAQQVLRGIARFAEVADRLGYHVRSPASEGVGEARYYYFDWNLAESEARRLHGRAFRQLKEERFQGGPLDSAREANPTIDEVKFYLSGSRKMGHYAGSAESKCFVVEHDVEVLLSTLD